MEVMTGQATLRIHPPTPPDNVKLHRAFTSDTYLSPRVAQVDGPPQTLLTDIHLNKAKQTLSSPSYLSHIAAQVLQQTQVESPSSSDESRSISSERRRKRVDFLQGEPKFLTASSKDIIAAENALLSSPPSHNTKPLKSILKPYKDSPLSGSMGNGSVQPIRDFPRMLEDVARELGNQSQSSRLDAYKTLNGCLQAYDNLPDLGALEAKMSLLTGFIQRDLKKVGTSNESIYDTQLIQQVLKLLTYFVWTPKISTLLQDEFCVAVLEQSISALADHTTAKQIVIQYMHLLAIQKFRSKVMTEERANRLIDVLRDIIKHIKGTTVTGSRLRVYKALLAQVSPLMMRRADDWITDLYHGMLSSIKDVRVAALAFGLDAGFSLGHANQVSRCVINLFNRTSSQGKKFADVIVGRLNEMLAEKNVKNDGVHVPQVWSITLLFLRSKPKQFEQWGERKRWLDVITNCFNSTESLVKNQAYVAWNRFIFAVSPDSSTDPVMKRILRQPIKNELVRKSDDKRPKQPKKAVYASYCTLLYYAFRPSLSHENISRAWIDYITPLLDKSDPEFGCEVLLSLLGDTPPKVWNEKRVIGIDHVKPEELPRLDAKWIRGNAQQVLNVLQLYLRSSDWYLADGTEASMLRIWRAFTKALSDAASKEVKVSGETMSAVAQIMTCLKQFWADCERRDNRLSHVSDDLRRLDTLVKIAVENMGPLPFNEKRLISGITSPFEVFDTSSNNQSQNRGDLGSATTHLITMLFNSIPGADYSAAYGSTIESFLEIAFRSATSRSSKLAILRDLCHIASSGSSILQSNVSPLISQCLLRIKGSTKPDDITMEKPYQPGLEYEDMLQILELEAQSHELSEQWKTTFEQICNQVVDECGTAGMIISIAEPFANFLYKELNKKVADKSNLNEVVYRVTLLIKNTSWPESRGDMGRAYKALWGAGSSMPKAGPVFTPFDMVYSLLDHALATVYELHTRVHDNDGVELLQAVSSFIEACPRSQSSVLLRQLQLGIASWVNDRNGILSNSDESRPLHTSVLRLWQTVTDKIRNLPRFDTALLSTLSTLIIAGLSCKQRVLLTLSVNTWNSTFGLVTDIVYPDNLRGILLRLRSIALLQAPGFDIASETQNPPFEPVHMPNEELLLQLTRAHGLGGEPQLVSPNGRVDGIINKQNPITDSLRANSRGREAMRPTTPTFQQNGSTITFTAINSSPRTPKQNRSTVAGGTPRDDVARQLNIPSLPIAKGATPTSSPRLLSKAKNTLGQSFDGPLRTPQNIHRNLSTSLEHSDLDHFLEQFAIDQTATSSGARDTVDPSTLLNDHVMHGMDESDSDRQLARLLRQDMGYEDEESSPNPDNATVTPRDTLMSEDLYEDEVAAQLAYDMQRAASQAASSPQPSRRSKKDAVKKRKRSSQLQRDYERDYSEEPRSHSPLRSSLQDSIKKRKRTRVSSTISSSVAGTRAVGSKTAKKKTPKTPSSSQVNNEVDDPKQSEEEILDCIVLAPPPMKPSTKKEDSPAFEFLESRAVDKTKPPTASESKGKGKAKEATPPPLEETPPSDTPPSSPSAVDNSELARDSPTFVGMPSSSAPARLAESESRMERSSPYLFKRREKPTAKEAKKSVTTLKASELFKKRSITPTQSRQTSSGRRSRPSQRLREIIMDDDFDIPPADFTAKARSTRSRTSSRENPINIDPDTSDSVPKSDKEVEALPSYPSSDEHPALDSPPPETPPESSPMRTRSKKKGIARRIEYHSDHSGISEVTPQPTISDTPPSASAKLRNQKKPPVNYNYQNFIPSASPSEATEGAEGSQDRVASPSGSAEAHEADIQMEEDLPASVEQDSESQTPKAMTAQAAPEEVRPQSRAGAMLFALKQLLEGAKTLVLGPGELRPIARVLHQLGVELDAAEERGN